MQMWKTLLVAWLLVLAGTMPAVASGDREQWGPFAGRIVDADTGEAITGAVMLVFWLESYGVALLENRFYEAREAVTDRTGRWEIPPLEKDHRRVTVQPPMFHVFAAGYELSAEIVTPKSGIAYLDETVTTMKRLTTRSQLVRKSRSRPSEVPVHRMPALTRAINQERQMLGYDLIPIPPSP